MSEPQDKENVRAPLFVRMLDVDRRIVYVFVALALGVPLFFSASMPPVRLDTAKDTFDYIERLADRRDRAVAEGKDYKKIVLVAVDWSASTRAELYPQTEAVVRHLMMRKLKFVIVTSVFDGPIYTKTIPELVAKDYGAKYGEDWVDLGYKFGRSVFVEHLARDFQEAAKADADGTPVKDLAVTKEIKDATDISLAVEITGLVGALDMWLQFFQTEKYRPDLAHGCTAITIPEAYNYLASGQIIGLFEGIAGAAAYNEYLGDARTNEDDPKPSQEARIHMTSQTFAHVLIFIFILVGNIGLYLQHRTKQEGRTS